MSCNLKEISGGYHYFRFPQSLCNEDTKDSEDEDTKLFWIVLVWFSKRAVIIKNEAREGEKLGHTQKVSKKL